MIVLDASAAVDWLLQTPAGQRIEQRIYAGPHAQPHTQTETLHTVHLLDVEFAQVLRRLVREGTLAPKRAEEAIDDLAALRMVRYGPVLLLKRIWQLRQNLSAYDASYVALAEELKAPLITRDQRLAAAPGHRAAIEVF
jgi:predicted nucleic acid-binding protein